MDKMVPAANERSAPVPQYDTLNGQFQAALQVVDDIVLKNYISQLHDFEIVPLDEHIKLENLSENVRLFKITEMVYEKDEFSTYKFASVFNALSTSNCAVFIIVDSNGEKTDFYMGIRSLNSELSTTTLKDTLKKAMIGQFPGIKTEEYLDEDMHKLLDIKASNISIVSCVANSKDENNRDNKAFIQGLEKLALAMQGEKYTAIIIANGTKQSQLAEVRGQYENIYSQLSPFLSSQVSYGTNSSVTASTSLSKGTSQAVTDGWSKSEGTSDSITKPTDQGRAGSIMSGALTAAGTIIGTIVAPGVGTLVGSSIGSAMGGAVAGSMQETQNVTKSTQFAESKSKTDTETESLTDTQAFGRGSSQNLQITTTNRKIKSTLDRIDLQLERLQEFESLGMWECAAYFLSDKPYAAEIAASTYKSLMRGENSGVEICAVNSWRNYEKEKVALLSEYALNMIHPVFKYKSISGDIQVTPSSLVSGNELAIHMGLPRRSVCGFPVIEHADFGKEVVSYTHESTNAVVNLGKVFNMGSECNNSVMLDRRGLSMHTFVTGSTGSGKSNTVYEILRQLDAVGVHYLVVEPAKGEYKNVFGNKPGVSVLGTNPAYTSLLRINPFKFPKGIHVLEHVDRLVEIFNVCWPMYAAMPAVLKEAVLQAYEVCGWDLVNSVNNVDDDLYPTFKDLLTELVDVIDKSAYDQEVKSNYKGSLETRVKSLTNGLNGQLFSTNEIDNHVLFDTNVIVDLSRVGSLETKSLLMGIIVMRLNEYRMTSTEGMNVALRHVTVLEEAHNILKRTSSEQNMESANVSGKSVEMLSNAIAEMRTYGEGFIIADQSPSAVDISAIRNTNTKIIMRLPDETDRRLAGKSAALKDEQLDEIAKLPRGVAVVYQNDWLEPVLCKIRRYSGKETPYIYDSADDVLTTSDEDRFESELLKLLLRGRVVEQIDVDIEQIDANLHFADISTKNKIIVYRFLSEYRKTGKLTLWEDSKFDVLSNIVGELLNIRNKVNKYVLDANDFDELSNKLDIAIQERLSEPSHEICLAVSQCLMKNFSADGEQNLNIYAAWRESILKRGVIL